MKDAGIIQICELVNSAENGAMPVEVLSPVLTDYYEERYLGITRYYAALGANARADILVRVWRTEEAKVGRYAVLSQSENDGQYRIIQVQNLLDDDGLKVTDITLESLGVNYDLATET